MASDLLHYSSLDSTKVSANFIFIMEIKQTTFLLHLLVFCFIFGYYGAKSSPVKLSQKENIEVEKQLKLINKPAVKILKTIYGDSYGCVDFYEQPAFNHPSMKNITHNINFNTFLGSRKIENSFGKIWVNGKGCPNGTVPIRRFTKDELVSSRRVAKLLASHQSQLYQNNNHHHFAIVRTKRDANRYFSGAGATMGIYNPFPVVTHQLSASFLSVGRDEDFLQTGWIVHPEVYHDGKTRMFVYTNSGGLHCFNVVCPGLVVLNPSVPVDLPILPVSTRGGKTFTLKFLIKRDEAKLGWIMYIKNDNIPIGYWPFRILNGLKSVATHIEWGGNSFSSDGVASPPIGSGGILLKGEGDTRKDAFCSNMFILDGQNVVDDKVDYVEEYLSDNAGYNVVDGGHDELAGHFIFYGGPGGK